MEEWGTDAQLSNEADNKRLAVESRWWGFTAEFFPLFCFKILKIEYWGEKNAWLAFLTRVTSCRCDTDMYTERCKHYTRLYTQKSRNSYVLYILLLHLKESPLTLPKY